MAPAARDASAFPGRRRPHRPPVRNSDDVRRRTTPCAAAQSMSSPIGVASFRDIADYIETSLETLAWLFRPQGADALTYSSEVRSLPVTRTGRPEEGDMRRHLTVLAATLGILVAAMPASAERVDDDPVHVALGDSQAFGIGTERPDRLGYVAKLSRWLHGVDCREGRPSACPRLELANLSVPGATTDSLIANQLPDALALIAERNSDSDSGNDVKVVTVTIGGNDIFGPLVSACSGGLTPECQETIAKEFEAAQENLAAILGSLRNATGPDTRIVISTYDNGLRACVLGDLAGFGDLALEGGPGFTGFNQIIEMTAAATGVEVADMFGALDVDDWVGGDDCVHPDKSGYHKMAKIFLDVLD